MRTVQYPSEQSEQKKAGNHHGFLLVVLLEAYLLLGVFLLELLHSSFSIDNLLFAGVKRVALGAYIQMDVLPCGSGAYNLAAGADNLDFFVIRVNSCFQFSPPDVRSNIKMFNSNRFVQFLAIPPGHRPNHHPCVGTHSNGFSGPYCLAFQARRPGSLEWSENDSECHPRANISLPAKRSCNLAFFLDFAGLAQVHLQVKERRNGPEIN
jgi:hypothetical protein